MELLSDISTVSTLIPLLISLIRFRNFEKGYFFLLILFVFASIADLLNFILVSRKANTSPIYHIYTLLEFTLILLYYVNFFKKYTGVVYLYYALAVFPFMKILDFYFYGLFRMDVISTSYVALVFLSISLYFFYLVMRIQPFNNIFEEPSFWINTGVLLYFSGNLMIFLFNNYLSTNYPDRQGLLWDTIHSILNIAFNLSMCIGIWKLKKA